MPGSFAPYTPLSQATFADDRSISSTPSLSPTFTLHRTVKDAVDASIPSSAASGMNMAGFDTALIQIVPRAGNPSPNIEVLQWSKSAGKFVSFVSAKTFSAPSANTPYTVEAHCYGAIIWVKVGGTMAANDVVDVLVAGAELDRSQ